MEDCQRYVPGFTSLFAGIVKKLNRRDPALLKEINRGMEKVLNQPMLGKPLGNVLRSYRRIHIEGYFVLLYEIKGCIVRFVDFDHHDRIYKKYS